MSTGRRETGKQRSQRIQIDYYKQRSGLDRFRFVCVWIAFLASVGYVCYLYATVSSQGGGNHVSTGPVAKAHASFEQDCEQCHLDFTPMDPAAPNDWLTLVGIEADAARSHVEQACQNCHPVGSHHRERMHATFAEVDQNCAYCHQDHQGREHDLLDINKSQCLACHQNLHDVVNGEPSMQANVTGFNEIDHGNFRSLAKEDPGRIRFSHQQHLMPGQVLPSQEGGTLLSQLSPADRERYQRAGQGDEDLVMLDCRSCHSITGEELLGRVDDLHSIDITRLGSSMNPVRFDKHCAACHKLSAGSTNESAIPIPHAVAWDQLESLLAASINGDRGLGLAVNPTDSSRDIPQLGLGQPSAVVSDWRVTSEEIAAARQRIESQCRDCHDADSITDEAIEEASRGTAEPMIPQRWLTAGYYDHARHRQIACESCHQDAFRMDTSVEEVKFDDARHVMIDGIESCQGCHRPVGLPLPDMSQTNGKFATDKQLELWGTMPTWASDECTMCHRYHEHSALDHVSRSMDRSGAVSRVETP